MQTTNPYENKNSTGKRLGNWLGCACLLVFAIFEELWIGMFACAIGFALICGIQVFHDKTAKLHTSLTSTSLWSPWLWLTPSMNIRC